MQTIYRPGQWYLIVIPGALVALPPDVHNDLVSRLWERLPVEKTLASVMDVLTTAAGGSFVALPPFAAAVVEGSAVRIALRGGVVARVSSETGAAYELSGAEVTTWSEHFVGDATRIEITVEETDAAAVLPVQSGIVRAAAASAELEVDDAAPIAAALGSTPRIDPVESGASAAALAGGAAPALALFGGPSSPSVDGTPDLPGAATSATVTEPAEPVAEEQTEPDEPTEPEEPAVEEPAVEEPTVEEPTVEELAAVEPDEPTETAEPAADEPAADDPAADEPAEDESFDLPEETIVSAPAAPVAAAGAIPPPPAIPDLPGAPLLSPPPLPDDARADETIAGDNGLDEHTWEPPQRSSAPQNDLDEIEQLFDETLQGGSDGSEGSEAPPASTVAPAPALGDHDGATITSAELDDLRRRQSVSDDVATQVLDAVPAGHGRIRVSSGQVVELDRTVIIGRRPRSTRASGHDLPHLVAVDSPQQDISRNHLEIRPDAGTVVVIDLRTTNGSTLVRPGAEPMRLHPGEQTLVLSGDVVDLGDGVTVLFEDIP
ncbi:FHA domain-containing protein [Microbacterium sp. NPDC097977]|uniref:FHA domain-containing protein n=1 Tax=Microbacterium sp. NPDC097977 TaxID=3155686 RepID=UPI00332321B2